jgi:glycosyltransferase involved in cell wall biosynthesis
MEKIKITVAVIAKNEEANIARCLGSVKWADEIVVVDGFSTDRTAEIAASMGAKIVQRKFSGSFADERNAAMDNARHNWVLHIDADDVVTEDFRQKLGPSLSESEDIFVFKFRRRNFFLGHSMDHGGFHHYIPNLVNKKHVRYEGRIHEVPVYAGKEGVIDADIEHYPFNSIAQFIERQSRYSDIASREMFSEKGGLSDKEIKKNLTGRTFKIFWKSYVRKQGYREGLYGLVFAALFAFINFMKWAKYWELCRKEKGPGPVSGNSRSGSDRFPFGKV